jgi:hypothetical protein
MKIDKSENLEMLNELFIKVENSLPSSLENSVFYARLKNSLSQEIMKFSKEQIELKNDLMSLKDMVGDTLPEYKIREKLDSLMAKYNRDGHDDNVAMIYHMESTRIDYGVPVIIIVKRDIVYVKKFVFRFRKESSGAKVGD